MILNQAKNAQYSLFTIVSHIKFDGFTLCARVNKCLVGGCRCEGAHGEVEVLRVVGHVGLALRSSALKWTRQKYESSSLSLS